MIYLYYNPDTNRSPFEYEFSHYRISLGDDQKLQAEQISLQPLYYDGEGRIMAVMDELEGTSAEDRRQDFLSSDGPYSYLFSPGSDKPEEIAYGYRPLSHLSEFYYYRAEQFLLLTGSPNHDASHPDALAVLTGSEENRPITVLEVLDDGTYIYRCIGTDHTNRRSLHYCRYAGIDGGAAGSLPSEQLYPCCSIDGMVSCIDKTDYGIELWSCGEQALKQADLQLPQPVEEMPSFAACLPDGLHALVIQGNSLMLYAIRPGLPQLELLDSWTP
ncbi:MAG: hypothetical protein R3F46_00665 [bacterium]